MLVWLGFWVENIQFRFFCLPETVFSDHRHNKALSIVQSPKTNLRSTSLAFTKPTTQCSHLRLDIPLTSGTSGNSLNKLLVYSGESDINTLLAPHTYGRQPNKPNLRSPNGNGSIQSRSHFSFFTTVSPHQNMKNQQTQAGVF